MKRTPQILLPTALICAFNTLPAHADPVAITSGFVLMTAVSRGISEGELDIAGTNGFHATATVSEGPGQGRVDAFEICEFEPDCQPGYNLSIGAWLGPTDGLTNTVVSFGGVEYREFGLESPIGFLVEPAGSVTLPAFGDLSSRTLTTPFVLTGLFQDPARGRDLQLTGQGTATLWLRPESSFTFGEPGWSVDRIRYDFDESAPVPEPSTLLLAGTALAAAFRARRRRYVALPLRPPSGVHELIRARLHPRGSTRTYQR